MDGRGGTVQDAVTLKVVTLNLAHGRKDAWHQALLKRATIQANLDEIVRILMHEQPDVVALQEADAPSLWSGRFHHVAYLSEKTGISYFVLGEHVRRMKLAYGTALISRHHLHGAMSHRFAPSPPTQLKGMVSGAIHWPGKQHVLLDLVSAHLDFSRKSVRQRQAREIIQRLAGHQRPLVLMGDFNCGFCTKDTTLSMLARELNLQTHEPGATEMVSFPLRNKRFDWIMISAELAFLEYRTLPDVLSDHRAVMATLKFVRRQSRAKSQ
jgi:endonuclease/exonuclease/phosphatase family metal-dependent hydrolase